MRQHDLDVDGVAEVDAPDVRDRARVDVAAPSTDAAVDHNLDRDAVEADAVLVHDVHVSGAGIDHRQYGPAGVAYRRIRTLRHACMVEQPVADRGRRVREGVHREAAIRYAPHPPQVLDLQLQERGLICLRGVAPFLE